MNVFNNLIIFIILLISKSIRSWSNNYKFHVNVQTKCYCTNETVNVSLYVQYSSRSPYDTKSGKCSSNFSLLATTAWGTLYDLAVDIFHNNCTSRPKTTILVKRDCKNSRYKGYDYYYNCNEN
uniref:NTR domain-containing protein n=1 Tax=Strongyloides venezuelensis TaxID=75913 RepID=A0A0K0F175_STRVS